MSDQTKTGPSLSGPSKDGHNTLKADARGAHSLAEVLSQPQCWSACLARLHQQKTLEAIRDRFAKTGSWLFVGCGSSYYVALAAAASMTSITGRPARGLPASEMLLYPELVLPVAGDSVAVLISRSGRTSEVLKAAELLKSRRVSTLAITCDPGQPLKKIADVTISLPAADEQSTVMTRSFSSMLLALQELAGVLAGDSRLCDLLQKMPANAGPLFETLPSKIRDFVKTHHFADYVCLGQGPFYALACEYALKITEMSLCYAQSFHTLEFRHGPKSIVGPETLLVFLLSKNGYASECEVLEEMKSLRGTTLVVTNKAEARVRAAADLLVELSLDVSELARLAPSLVAGQLLGLYTGLQKGLNPDSPRNLSRVVTLDDDDSSNPSEHVTL